MLMLLQLPAFKGAPSQIISELEHQTDKATIPSNQAMCWYELTLLNVEAS